MKKQRNGWKNRSHRNRIQFSHFLIFSSTPIESISKRDMCADIYLTSCIAQHTNDDHRIHTIHLRFDAENAMRLLCGEYRLLVLRWHANVGWAEISIRQLAQFLLFPQTNYAASGDIRLMCERRINTSVSVCWESTEVYSFVRRLFRVWCQWKKLREN